MGFANACPTHHNFPPAPTTRWRLRKQQFVTFRPLPGISVALYLPPLAPGLAFTTMGCVSSRTATSPTPRSIGGSVRPHRDAVSSRWRAKGTSSSRTKVQETSLVIYAKYTVGASHVFFPKRLRFRLPYGMLILMYEVFFMSRTKTTGIMCIAHCVILVSTCGVEIFRWLLLFLLLYARVARDLGLC